MTPKTFERVVAAVIAAGFADDIPWSETAGPPESAEDFASEAIFVICNSGMKNTVARGIFNKVMPCVEVGGRARTVFGHPGKSSAIDFIWENRDALLAGYEDAPDKVEFCASIPWIGRITKHHLAKNFGADVAKPDVHLQRLADIYGETVQGLCDRLARASGFKARTVDLVLWRACAEGLIDSKTGNMRSAASSCPGTNQTPNPMSPGGEP